MTDQKENSMTILDEEEAERLDQLREHIRQGVVPGQASGVFLLTVIDRQQALLERTFEALTDPALSNEDAHSEAYGILVGRLT